MKPLLEQKTSHLKGQTELHREIFRFLLLAGTDIRESSRVAVNVRDLSILQIKLTSFLFRIADIREH